MPGPSMTLTRLVGRVIHAIQILHRCRRALVRRHVVLRRGAIAIARPPGPGRSTAPGLADPGRRFTAMQASPRHHARDPVAHRPMLQQQRVRCRHPKSLSPSCSASVVPPFGLMLFRLRHALFSSPLASQWSQWVSSWLPGLSWLVAVAGLAWAWSACCHLPDLELVP